MALDFSSIFSIVGGVANTAVGLTTAGLNYSASIYAVDHAPLPVADISNYNIVVPESKQTSAITPAVIGLIAVLFIMLLIGAIVLLKVG